MNANEPPDEVAPGRQDAPEWWIYRGNGHPLHDIRLDEVLPDPPPWRKFLGGPLPANDTPPEDDGEIERRLGHERSAAESTVDAPELDMINAALYLRRPLIVTGPPGAGKSSLAFRIARSLRLGRVVQWHITSHTMLKDGLYKYDAIGRAEAAAARYASIRSLSGQHRPADDTGPDGIDAAGTSAPGERLGDFVRLGPLGTAFLPSKLPRVLLIDEFDKSEFDLPNDLLGIFEEATFPIPELERVRQHMPEVTVFTDDPDRRATIVDGRVRCRAFPIIIITSNGERDFPPAFLRRCLQLEMRPPDADELAARAAAHLVDMADDQRLELVREFVRMSERAGGLPADRLLDAMFLATSGAYDPEDRSWPRIRDALWRHLRTTV
ncbi:MAG TPA: MoxR family ATPase [Pseudonocardiaceae bacterium]|jgi:MoxR-like ATPase|nr:MoxR family ATPase [Pseudonocardiaceae bacterium]